MAAKLLDRRFVGYDIDGGYLALARIRIAATPQSWPRAHTTYSAALPG